MKRLALCIALFVAHATLAELQLAHLFSDGMVLQREQPVPVWGWADPGVEVTVTFGGQELTTTVGEDGKFMVYLKDMQASADPQVLKVLSGGEEIEVRNVLVGEVWLCSGQSNMQWPVKNAKDFGEEQPAAKYPNIRMFLVDLVTANEPQKDCTGSWNVCSPENVGEFSATAYFFGREIHKELGVPVGLIRSCWGGTRIEAWSPMESLKQFPAVMQYKEQQDKGAAAFDEAVEVKRFEKQMQQWKLQVQKAKSNGGKPPRRPKQKINPHQSQNYPANLYNAMIHPLVPYGIRGTIWYQGEANADTVDGAVAYSGLLENMVTQWRKDWGIDFPFYAVQLPNFKSAVDAPVQDSGWAFIRESFLKFSREVANAGMAVGIDVGEADNIHPKNKQPIGYRLARQALVKTYGKDGVPGGPVYRSMKKDGNKIIIQFDNVGSGLVEQGGNPLKTFAIAGADRKFVAAPAAIVDDTVIVSSEQVPDPVAVRYAWSNNPEGCNLFNKEGFPASPFRTDDWSPAGE